MGCPGEVSVGPADGILLVVHRLLAFLGLRRPGICNLLLDPAIGLDPAIAGHRAQDFLDLALHPLGGIHIFVACHRDVLPATALKICAPTVRITAPAVAAGREGIGAWWARKESNPHDVSCVGPGRTPFPHVRGTLS